MPIIDHPIPETMAILGTTTTILGPPGAIHSEAEITGIGDGIVSVPVIVDAAKALLLGHGPGLGPQGTIVPRSPMTWTLITPGSPFSPFFFLFEGSRLGGVTTDG